jgi:hypothetical protein
VPCPRNGKRARGVRGRGLLVWDELVADARWCAIWDL